jgi:calcineurin-like phosphoesterase family protein
MKRWIISDLHFEHINIIKYSNRPFQDIDEMRIRMIEYWNNLVSSEDIVYFLGDFAMGRHSFVRDSNLVKSLSGTKYMILGNHDVGFNLDGGIKVTRVEDAIIYWIDCGFARIYDTPIILDNFWILSHEPIEGINTTQIFANIHGHTHTIDMVGGNYFNASVEKINYEPIDFEVIKTKFAQ